MTKIYSFLILAIVFASNAMAQNIPSYVPTNGLVGWWPFNGNANDESGNGNHGTVNGASLTRDRFGNISKSYNFNGKTDYISVPNIAIQGNNERTFSSWFLTYYNPIWYTGEMIISTGSGSNLQSGTFNLRLDNQNQYLGFMGFVNDYYPTGNVIVKDSVWHLAVLVYKDDTLKFYVDGQFEKSTYQPGLSTNGQSNFFGKSNDINQSNQSYWIGKLDDIGIWNRALSQQEITALYNGTNQSLPSTKVFVDAPATVKQNETLELAIGTEALNTADNVISFQTDFAYDSTRYTYEGNNLVGTLNSNGTVVVNSTKNGKLNISYMSQTALNGAGSLVKLKFKANNKVGQGIFSLSNFLYNTTNITSLKSDTVNTIDVIPPTAKLTYSVNPARKGDSLLITVNFSEKMAVSPVPQFNLTGQNTLGNTNLNKVNDSTYTYWWVVEKGNGAVNVNLATGKDLAGNGIVATPTQNPSFTIIPTVFGDIDTNKLVQAYDAALALQYSVGLNPLPTMDPLPWSNWRLAVANVDTVGSVTANDASLILQHSAKLISSFPADAKKRGGELPIADVTVKREGNQLVFRTTGTLYAFNGYFKDNFNAFGQPEIKDKNAMVASNINATTYNVGLASSTPFNVNEPFLIIPIVATTDIAGTIDIVANTQEKALTYTSAAVASINEATTTTMNVYPNPTKDVVTVTNAQGKTLRIIDFQGRIVNTQAITNNTHEVSLKPIGSKGEYIFQLLGENNETITTQKVVMQ